MDRAEHAKARAGLLTSSVANTLLNGGEKGWNTLLTYLWDTDGQIEDFQKMGPQGSARRHGQEEEEVAAARFWFDHPEYLLRDPKFVNFYDPDSPFYQWVGDSPDRLLVTADRIVASLEIKCPVTPHVWAEYVHAKLLFDRTGRLPPQHVSQCQWHLWVNNLDYGYLYIDYIRPPLASGAERLATDLTFKYDQDNSVINTLQENTTKFIEHLESGQPFKQMSMSEVADLL